MQRGSGNARLQDNHPGKNGRLSGSIAHAASMLNCISKDTHSLTDIARQCDFSKSTVHRVLNLLEQSQLVVQDTINRRYYISLLISKLASNVITTHKRLASISEETLALDIISGIRKKRLPPS